jgi:SAM-dependent methyltransferase
MFRQKLEDKLSSWPDEFITSKSETRLKSATATARPTLRHPSREVEGRLRERGLAQHCPARSDAEGAVSWRCFLVNRGGWRVLLSLGDAGRLPFASQTFDLVVAHGLISWLNSPLSALTEMARVCKPGGYAVVTCANPIEVGIFRGSTPVAAPRFPQVHGQGQAQG